jgi:hypothetical protein
MSDESNLLEETIKLMAEHGKAPTDVRFVVGNPGCHYRISVVGVGTWEDFAALADIKYDNGFGGAEIDEALQVVGDDWWLERHEYDGSEWWEFKTLPRRAEGAGPLVSLMADYEPSET